jgi:hypothetical protein
MQITTHGGIERLTSARIVQSFAEEQIECLYSLHILPELGSALNEILISKGCELLYKLTETGVLLAFPSSVSPLEVKSPNGLCAWLSPLACGHFASLLAYSSLAYANSPGLCLLANRQLDLLGAESRRLPEWHVIRALMA